MDMLSPGRKLDALLFGRYVVIESVQYGLQFRYRRIGRFFKLDKAKTFAKAESARLHSRVVVMTADNLAKLFVYKPRPAAATIDSSVMIQ
jgi:hypothetical protein